MEFFAAANVSSSFPPPDVPEIAFAGTALKKIIPTRIIEMSTKNHF